MYLGSNEIREDAQEIRSRLIFRVHDFQLVLLQYCDQTSARAKIIQPGRAVMSVIIPGAFRQLYTSGISVAIFQKQRVPDMTIMEYGMICSIAVAWHGTDYFTRVCVSVCLSFTSAMVTILTQS